MNETDLDKTGLDKSGLDEIGPRLLGVAYRILGSRAEAEDAVQDTYLKWQTADRAAIDNPASWMMRVCARRSIDLLRSARRKRVQYVGEWLPEPVSTMDESPDAKLERAASVTTAFLLLLERLTPRERAAYVLREIFDVPYDEIAAALDLQEPACRKLVSRALLRIGEAKPRHLASDAQQRELLAAFEAAVATGDIARLAERLADDIQLRSDSGGRVQSINRVLRGPKEVLGFVGKVLHRHNAALQWSAARINGQWAWVVRDGEAIRSLISFEYDVRGCVRQVFLTRNPDKLARVDQPPLG
ncbi:MAG: RNA polymerase sigma factor SigJ [Tepidisphaeraceae bacterium]